MRKTLIIGATSAIAQATARLFAEAGDALFLVARNADKLADTADDLRFVAQVQSTQPHSTCLITININP